MGYRHYLYLADKAVVDSLRDITPESIDGLNYCSPYELLGDRTVHEFGKYLDEKIYNALAKRGNKLFKNPVVHDRYSDYDVHIVSRARLMKCINEVRLIVLKQIKDNLKDIEEDIPRFMESMKINLKYKEIEWEKPLKWDEIKANNCFNDSWMYEYAIFNLMQLMLSVDWDKQELILMGY